MNATSDLITMRNENVKALKTFAKAHRAVEAKTKKKKLNSRWHSGNRGVERYSTERRVTRTRWVKDRNNKWKLETESVNEIVYCFEGTGEAPGFYKGAIKSPMGPGFVNPERIDKIAHMHRMLRYAEQQKYHHRE